MVSAQSVDKQLKRIKFNKHSWGRAEVSELPKILMPEEEIYECVNGMYEGGFALLVATDSRVLLIDKKPLNYLTVEDLRFEMINELDYSHRLIGAQITISAGAKSLQFKSYNQPRLRKLITHVQHCMAEGKKNQTAGQADQKQHLEQINQQLQAYLIAQHEQQQALRERLDQVDKLQQLPPSARKENTGLAQIVTLPELPKPSPELSDYLFAQSLLKQYREKEQAVAKTETPDKPVESTSSITPIELYADGVREIFNRKQNTQVASESQTQQLQPKIAGVATEFALPSTPAPSHNPLEINALSIAYSKLPMALRNRKFGRPSFHAHSQAVDEQLAAMTPQVAP